MRLEVVGSAGSQPGGGQACSGYLVSTDTTNVLLDCGFGVAARLTGVLDPTHLDAVVITHRHLDHSIDLLGLFRVLWAGDDVIPVFAAADVAESLEVMVKPRRRPDWDRVLPWTTVAAGDRWDVGDLAFEAFDSDHPVPTVSLRLRDGSGTTMAYSSDTGGGADLYACALDVDLFLCEATWQGAADDRRGDGHLTAAEAGAIASAAGVARLVLTHLRPHLDPDQSLDEAGTSYSGPLGVARDGDVHEW